LSMLIQQNAEMWVQAEAITSGRDGSKGLSTAALSPNTRRQVRKPIDALIKHYADAAGATVFCDKSLTTVDHLPTIAQCYPEASFIFLYRFPLDVMASGHEASRWGYNAYGFAPFVHATPGNFLVGLANYWIDRASKMVAFERNCAQPHARVYYEALCDDPTATVARLIEFLRLPPDPELVPRMFSSEHGEGPGDYKIDFSGAVAVDSIGRGATLPDTLGPFQLTRIDELLAELDYPSLSAARSGQLAALMGLRNAVQALKPADDTVEAIIAALSRRSPGDLLEAHRAFFPIEIELRIGSGRPVLLQVAEDGVSRLTEPSAAGNGAPARVICAGDVLLRIGAGKLNFAQAMHERLLVVEQRGQRAAPEQGEEPERERPRRVLAALAALIRVG